MGGMTAPKDDNWGRPHLPPSPSLSIDGQSLTAIRDFMTAMPPDSVTEQALASVMQKWDSDPRSVEPIRGIRQVLDRIRLLPRGQSRLTAMNTLVRTLGRPQALATLLDMLRDSAAREGTHEASLTLPSRNGTQHAVYGWAGQTLLLLSDFGNHEGAVEAEPGSLEVLGEKERCVKPAEFEGQWHRHVYETILSVSHRRPPVLDKWREAVLRAD